MGFESNPYSSYENQDGLNPGSIEALQQFLEKAEQEDNVVSPDGVFPVAGEADIEGSDPVGELAGTIAETYAAEYGDTKVPSSGEARQFVSNHLSAEGEAPETEYIDFVAEKLVEILSERK